MVIASIILGILLIIGGVTCIAAPVDTYLRAAHLLAIVLFTYGIFGIVRFFKQQGRRPRRIINGGSAE